MKTMGSGLEELVPLPGVFDSGLVDPSLAPLDNLDPIPTPDPTHTPQNTRDEPCRRGVDAGDSPKPRPARGTPPKGGHCAKRDPSTKPDTVLGKVHGADRRDIRSDQRDVRFPATAIEGGSNNKYEFDSEELNSFSIRES